MGGGLTPKAGDVVIVHSQDPRLSWKKAIVVEPIISDDGHCRSCVIKTSTGTRVRATKHLHPLELIAESFRDQRNSDPSTEENFEGFEEGGERLNRAKLLRDSMTRLNHTTNLTSE